MGMKPRPFPFVIAHRGASFEAPENTMAAFSRAVEMNVDMIELDVRMSADGELIVIHDETVDRTAHGAVSGRVDRLRLEEIRSLDAGRWKGPAFAGEKVPTLKEVLQSFGDRARFLVELKAPKMESRLAQIIEETNGAERVVLQSFDPQVVAACRRLMPHIPAGLLFSGTLGADEDPATDWVEQTLHTNASMMGVNVRSVNARIVRYVKQRALCFFVWTVNDPRVMGQMIQDGVDGIITDDPKTLLHFMKKHG